MRDVNTRGVDTLIQWSPALYGMKVTPGNLVMYVDDGAISTGRVGSGRFGIQCRVSDSEPLKPESVVRTAAVSAVRQPVRYTTH